MEAIKEMEESKTKQQLFSKEDLKKLIVPLLFEQALAITVGMADTVMISSAGEAAVSGVSLIDMFNNLIISVLAALATGGAVVTSQFLGAGKKEDACKSAKQLIVSSVCITIGISILVMVFCNGIISLFFGKIEADVFHNAVIYMMISALSFPFLALYARHLLHQTIDVFSLSSGVGADINCRNIRPVQQGTYDRILFFRTFNDFVFEFRR